MPMPQFYLSTVERKLSAMRVRLSSPVTWCVSLLMAVVAMAWVPGGQAVWAQPLHEEATESAVYLLRQSVTVRRGGEHLQVLRALRHLRDPQLQPLFEKLIVSDHSALQIHGILGVAELSEHGRVTLSQLMEIKEPLVQAAVISAAMDSELLHVDEMAKLLEWSDLDDGVALVLMARLIEAGKLQNTDRLHAAARSDRAARRAMAGLLLHELGDPQGNQILQELNDSTDPQREHIRDMLLVTALRHGLARSGGWAYAIAMQEQIDPAIEMLALHASLRFGVPQATRAWQQRFTTTENPAVRTRLALLALQLAVWLDESLFTSMVEHEDRLIAQMGQAGVAIARGGQDIPEQVVALVQMHHMMSTAWAISYAREHANHTDSQLILLGVLDAYEQGPDQGRAQRLDNAMAATELLFEKDPQVAANLLRPILASPRTDARLIEAILLGLMRANEPGAHQVVADLEPFGQRRNNHLALLVRARAGEEQLTTRQMDELALLVQGGGGLQLSLRIQAMWFYLQRTDQTQQVLTRVLQSI